VSGNTRLAAVIGDPVRYSLSPALHNAAYDAMGLDIIYVAFPIAGEHLALTIPALSRLDLVGLSVTIPHKEAVIPLLDTVSETAQSLNAVNCILQHDGALHGHNTDGAGFARALVDEARFDVNNKKCVIIGAGGAARAVVSALSAFGPRELVVVNRSARNLEQALLLAGEAGRAGTIDDVSDADLVVNATPVGTVDASTETPVDVSLLNASQLVVDLIYHPAKTRLLTEAQAQGAQTMNGLSMLVYQAALQIELWTNQFPPIDVMFDAVK
jgi:shikimate dehydrogenase